MIVEKQYMVILVLIHNYFYKIIIVYNKKNSNGYFLNQHLAGVTNNF